MTTNVYDLLDDNVKKKVGKNIELLLYIINKCYIPNAGTNQNKINQYELNIVSLTKFQKLINAPMSDVSSEFKKNLS